jgi:hypothetical protein
MPRFKNVRNVAMYDKLKNFSKVLRKGILVFLKTWKNCDLLPEKYPVIH